MLPLNKMKSRAITHFHFRTTNSTEAGQVQAVDPEGAAITAFAILGGNTGDAFKIDNDGVIRVNDASQIDFETLAKYMLTINATDESGASGTGTFIVNVTNNFIGLTIPALNEDNTIIVSRIGNNLVARRNGVDLIEPTRTIEDIVSLTINGGSARDTVILDASLNSAGSPATKRFGGQIVFHGNEGDDKLDASRMTVTTFGVTFNGGAGNDTALGGAGHDTFNGGDGNDLLVGGKGNDTYRFANTNIAETDTVTELSSGGLDTLDFSQVTSNLNVDLILEVNLATHANRRVNTSATGSTRLSGNFENVIGGRGNDLILGNAAANNLFGGAGNDSIDGDSGNDTINGGVDDDVIRGNDGNDLIVGGAGNDTILGEVGNDTLRGGDGDDLVIGGFGADRLFGDAGTDTGLGGQGGSARGGNSQKDSGDVLDATTIEIIDEAFNTLFAFE